MKSTHFIIRLSIASISAVLVYTLLSQAIAKQVEFPSKPPSGQVTVNGDLSKPRGEGPFPAVVVMHSCGGVDRRDQSVAKRLKRKGYVALVPDSFGPRGFDRCERGNFANHVKDQVHDALGAVAYLNSLPFVKKNHIAVMGYS